MMAAYASCHTSRHRSQLGSQLTVCAVAGRLSTACTACIYIASYIYTYRQVMIVPEVGAWSCIYTAQYATTWLRTIRWLILYARSEEAVGWLLAPLASCQLAPSNSGIVRSILRAGLYSIHIQLVSEGVAVIVIASKQAIVCIIFCTSRAAACRPEILKYV